MEEWNKRIIFRYRCKTFLLKQYDWRHCNPNYLKIVCYFDDENTTQRNIWRMFIVLIRWLELWFISNLWLVSTLSCHNWNSCVKQQLMGWFWYKTGMIQFVMTEHNIGRVEVAPFTSFRLYAQLLYNTNYLESEQNKCVTVRIRSKQLLNCLRHNRSSALV